MPCSPRTNLDVVGFDAANKVGGGRIHLLDKNVEGVLHEIRRQHNAQSHTSD